MNSSYTIVIITRYTFYAERGYLPHCSTNDSLTRQQSSQGLCPQTPTFSRYALGFLSADFQNNIRCSFFYINICCFIEQIVNFNMAAIGHLGIRFSWLCDHRRVPSAELMLNTKSGSNRTNRFEVIKILVNFSFLSAAILDLEKWLFWPLRCLRDVKTKLCVKFSENRTNGLGVIYVFCKLQYGGRRPSWIVNFDILGLKVCSGWKVDDKYQIWCI